MLNIKPAPGEELCGCSTCKRLEHEPMSLRVIRSRMHRRMDARAGRTEPEEIDTTSKSSSDGSPGRQTTPSRDVRDAAGPKRAEQ